MATSFPSGLDSFTNPTAVDTLDSPPHDTQHADANDAIEALQAKVGVDGSAVTTSLDYKVANLESRPVETKTASYVLVAADVNKRIVMNNAGATTITVNDGVFAAGDTVWIHNIGAGTTTVTAGTATVDTAGSLDVGQWEGGSLYFTSASSAIFFRGGGATGITVEYLVVGGGGAGGKADSVGSGGGGAGGYRNSYSTETSGGGATTEPTMIVQKGTNYTVTVAAGGAGRGTAGQGARGSDSFFHHVVSVGGGGGGARVSGIGSDGSPGGCGGGEGRDGQAGGVAVTNQGYNGDTSDPGGGGGAGQAPNNDFGGNNGASSSITGSAVTRSGGGGAANFSGSGTGGTGGGGNAYNGAAGDAGTANTGGGGGGSNASYNSGSGGSGVVIIRFPTADGTLTVGAGLTSSSTTDGTDTVVTFTAGTDTISWS